MVMLRLDLRELEGKLDAAVQEVILEFANELVNQLQIEAPVGATGRLQESFQIFRTGDGVVWLGTRVPYAQGVWKGKPPHTPNWTSIKRWARRKLDDESAAGPVFRSIQQNGTAPNPFVDEAIDNTMDRLGQLRFDDF